MKPLFVLFIGWIVISPLITPSASAQWIDQAIEFFTLHPNQSNVQRDSSLYPAKIILAPVITYAPETSVGLGVGAKFLFKLRGSGDETRTSNMPVSMQYTLENQLLIFSGFEIFSNQERWMLTGNLRFQVFPRFFYGIGRDTPESNEEEYDYTQILLEPTLLKRVFARYLFIGGGVRYNRISNVQPVAEGLLVQSKHPGALGSTSVGAQLATVYDSRDNLLNAHRGWYAEISHGFYGKVLGGTQQFQLTRLDLRHYTSLERFTLFRSTPAVLAFQLLTHFTYDHPPLGELAALGGDQIMRGYYEGRYLDRKMVAVQAEYRTRFSPRWGAVLFAGAGDTAARTRDFRLNHLRPSMGLGLRFLLDRREELNLRVDWGFGQQTNNYYLNVAEAF